MDKKGVLCLKGIIVIGGALTLCWEVGTGTTGMFLSFFLYFISLDLLLNSFNPLKN